MSALSDARRALVGYGEDLADICLELGLDSCELCACVDDEEPHVSFRGMTDDDEVVLSFRVELAIGAGDGDE